MTVKQLIKKLEKLPQNLRVYGLAGDESTCEAVGVRIGNSDCGCDELPPNKEYVELVYGNR